MSVFKSADHAKSSTKSIFDYMKANTKTKLSEFRNNFASSLGFKTFHDLLKEIDSNKTESLKITLLELLKLDCAIKVENQSFGSIHLRDSDIMICWSLNFDENGVYQDKFESYISYSDLYKAKINGNKIILIDDVDCEILLEIYLPNGSPNYDIQAISDTINVSIIDENGNVEDSISYINNSKGKSLAKKTFYQFMESNIDEYSANDFSDSWNDGCEFINGKKIIVTYDLNKIK